MQENLDQVFNRQRLEYKLIKSGKSLPKQLDGTILNKESLVEDD